MERTMEKYNFGIKPHS